MCRNIFTSDVVSNDLAACFSFNLELRSSCQFLTVGGIAAAYSKIVSSSVLQLEQIICQNFTRSGNHDL